MRSILRKQTVVLIAAMALTSCTPAPPVPKESTSDLAPQLAASLNCADAWEGTALPAPEAPTAEGVSSLSWTGSPSSYSWPIRDQMNGYPYTGNEGKEYGAWKTPISVEAGSGEQVITVESPPDAALIVASAAKWESGEALREGQLGLPDSYTVRACDDRAAQFPGMTLVQGPTCVVIRVTDRTTAESSTVSVPMYGGKCP